MTRRPEPLLSSSAEVRSTTPSRPSAPRMAPAVVLLLATLPAAAAPSPRYGVTGMSQPRTASLLVAYYETFLQDHDIDRFRRHVSARYTEGTLARLVQSGDVPSRRASVLALGLVGNFTVNEVVARALRDPDPTVRSLADNALWAIWYRADTPAHNAMLDQVRELNARHQFEEAIALATRLIARAPQFAEAYNQRAISEFFLGRFTDSAADCRRVLERNPYHFGALSGLGQCYLRLDQKREALKIFRKALKLQPYSDGLRDTVQALETEES